MPGTLKRNTQVLPGHRIEITAPELPEGMDVEVVVTPRAPDQTEIAHRFAVLAARWREETRALSSVSQIAMHPAYQEIIGMGGEVVPFILEEVAREPNHWFWALRAITGEDPILPTQRGRVGEMAAAWVAWGRAQR